MENFLNYTKNVSREYQDASINIDKLNRTLNDEFDQVKLMAYKKVFQGEKPKTVYQKQQTYSNYMVRRPKTAITPKRKYKTSRESPITRESPKTARNIWVTSPSHKMRYSQGRQFMSSQPYYLTSNIHNENDEPIKTKKLYLSKKRNMNNTNNMKKSYEEN